MAAATKQPTKAPEQDEHDEQAKQDARLLEAIIKDNEHWNSHGIAEADIAVCFEMSDRCDWGGSFSTARFRRALKAMRKSRVVCVAGRWFPTNSPNASARQETTDAAGRRVCARQGCKVELTDRRASATYCSAACRNRAHRRGTRAAS